MKEHPPYKAHPTLVLCYGSNPGVYSGPNGLVGMTLNTRCDHDQTPQHYQIDGLNLIPVAAIGAPIGWFRDAGYTFDRDSDDLDEYEFAAFEMAGEGAFALMHYDHATYSDTSLLFDDRINGQDAFLAMMAAVAKGFGLPGSLFHWRWNGQRVSLAQPATHGRDQAA